ncbi:hypothetical protein H5T52_00675 [Candidatus Bipolaricaulota bacterium]|nr:hypothetical protein [Candidatus Bipolaricaulota bacterium]
MRTLAAVFLIGLLGWQVAGAPPEIIPLSQIQAGMKGWGLTVVAGEEVSRFEVEVIGVIDEPGEQNDFIVIRAFGEAIERSGGISQGMSGSPVYLEGKLAGALSRAAMWSAEPDRPLGLVTPIEAMLKVLAEVKGKGPEAPPQEEVPVPKELRKMGVLQLRFCASPPGSPEPGTLYSWPLSTPVVAGGLSPRALSVLAEGLEVQLEGNPLSGLLPPWRARLPGLSGPGVGRIIQTPSSTGSEGGLPFSPGAPVGVGLLSGDVSLGALGTVTMVDGEAVLAFGHPFLFSGSTDYFLTSAHVFDTVAALDAPYKLGSLGEVRGAVLADRWAGIGGLAGRSPSPVRLNFSVWDEARGEGTQLSADMVREARYSALLAYVAGLEATDRALDRIGPGTVSVRYRIHGQGLPRPLERHNVFLSTEDIAVYVPWEAAIVADILEYNEFADPGLLEIDLDATVSDELAAVRILDLVVDKEACSPGDTVRFIVFLQDWRGEQTSWSGEFLIPQDLDTPYVELRAYGGPREVEKGEKAPVIDSLEALVDYIEGIPSYDTLTVELFALDPISELMGQPWLYGVSEVSVSVGRAVVYDQVSLTIPVRRE